MARDSTTSVPQLNSTDVRKVPLLKAYRIEEVYSRRRICRATVQSEEYPEWTKKLRSYKFGIAKCKPVYNAKTQTKNPPMLLWEGERYYHWQHAALLLGTSRQAVNYRMVTLSFNIPIPVIRFTLSSMALLGNALGYRWPPCHSNVVFVHESILNAVLVVPQRTLSQIERIPKHYKTRKHVVPQKDSFSEVDQDSVYEEEEEKEVHRRTSARGKRSRSGPLSSLTPEPSPEEASTSPSPSPPSVPLIERACKRQAILDQFVQVLQKYAVPV